MKLLKQPLAQVPMPFMLVAPDFGARAYARNFTQEELIRAIHTSHIHGKKLYLTVNTLLKNRELKERLYDSASPFIRSRT